MSDLVERLRKPVAKETREGFYTKTTYAADPLCSEAADEIDRLKRELADARRQAFIEAAEHLEASGHWEAVSIGPLRMPDGLRERVKAAAASNGRSMNSEIVRLIDEGLQEKIALAQVSIVAAAIFHGAVISLPAPARHHTILYSMDTEMGIDVTKVPPLNQGFITSEGKFVNRVEAYYIAYRAGQIEGKDGAPRLFSEDLW